MIRTVADLSRDQQRDFIVDFQNHENFARESLTIKDLGGSDVPMLLGAGQRKLWAAREAQRRKGKPVRIVCLKTRRSWFTMGACAQMFQDVAFFPGRKGVIIADRYRPAATDAFGYVKQMDRTYKNFERFGAGIPKPELTQCTEGNQMKLGWKNGSIIDVYSADSGEVRGGGRHFALYDEVAFWRDADTTLTGALSMVPKLPNTFEFVLSTANGQAGSFHEMCMKAQDPKGGSDWQFVFFGWLDHEIYKTPLTREEALKLNRDLDREEHVLHTVHGATLEQLAWRRSTLATECQGKLELLHAEYPTTSEEAFIASGRPVFDHVCLSAMPVSEGQPGELEIRESGPVRRLLFLPKLGGALEIWQKPKPGHAYVIGADPSQGVDVSEDQKGRNPDYSVACVIDRESGVQVAQLRDRIRPVAFAEYLALLGRYYNWAYVCPEANDAGFMDAILRTGYPEELIYHQRRDPTDRHSTDLQHIGFKTTTLTRDWLIAAIEDAIRDGSIQLQSRVALQECYTFVIKANGKKEHKDGQHDDCVLAAALAVMGSRTAPRLKPGYDADRTQGKAAIREYGKVAVEDDDD